MAHLPYRIIFRVPFIQGFTDSKDNMEAAIALMAKYARNPQAREFIAGIDIIGGHNLGQKKYESLGLECLKLPDASDKKSGIRQRIKRYKTAIEERTGIPARICIV